MEVEVQKKIGEFESELKLFVADLKLLKHPLPTENCQKEEQSAWISPENVVKKNFREETD